MDACAERGLFFTNTHQSKIIHRYRWARGNEKTLIDYIAVDNMIRREVPGAKAVKGKFSGSDYFALVAKVRMGKRWKCKGNAKEKVKEKK